MNTWTIAILIIAALGIISLYIFGKNNRVYLIAAIVLAVVIYLAQQGGWPPHSTFSPTTPTPTSTSTPTPTLSPTPSLEPERGQYYEENTQRTKVITVQISAGNLEGASIRRDEMINAGFDSFVYYKDGKYRVMCGKFRHKSDAEKYQEQIILQTKEDDAYLTNAYLSEDVINRFEAWYK